MKIEIYQNNDAKIAEVTSEHIIVNNIEEGTDLLGNLYYQGFDKIILHEKNITPDFFNLSTGIAGEILQKFSTYRVQLAVIGDFSKYPSKSLQDFIYESNKARHTIIVNSLEEAIEIFPGK